MAESQDHQAVKELVMHYRIERAVRRLGWIALLTFALAAVAAAMSLFTPKFL